MRLPRLAFALLVAAIVAGCAGGGGGAVDPTPATPSATPDAPTATTPEATPAVTPDEPSVPSGSPIPPPPRTVYNKTFDFSTQGDPTGQSPKTETSQNVGAEYTVLVVNVTIVRSSAAPTQLPISGTVNSPMVRVLDPEGQEILHESAEGAARTETVPAKSGTYTVRFEGAGTLKATVVLTATT